MKHVIDMRSENRFRPFEMSDVTKPKPDVELQYHVVGVYCR